MDADTSIAVFVDNVMFMEESYLVHIPLSLFVSFHRVPPVIKIC